MSETPIWDGMVQEYGNPIRPWKRPEQRLWEKVDKGLEILRSILRDE